jgi:POT family proton-dependent oligopeptide transporter
MLPNVSKAEVKTNDSTEKKSKSNSTTSPVALLLAAGLMTTSSLVSYFLLDDLAMGMAIGLFIGFIAWIFQISTKEERPRVSSLILVFIVVIFFWMSFHQNGLTLTFYARDYTVKTVNAFTNLFFNLESILAFIGSAAGFVLLVFSKTMKNRILATILLVGSSALCWFFM